MNETSKLIIRGVCVYDIVSTLGMAVPGLSVLTIGVYATLHQSLGLGGSFPVYEPTHHLFINLVGLLVFLWSFVRIRLLDRLLVMCDIFGRFYLTSLILYYVFAAGISQVFLAFVVTELLGAGLQMWALKKA